MTDDPRTAATAATDTDTDTDTGGDPTASDLHLPSHVGGRPRAVIRLDPYTGAVLPFRIVRGPARTHAASHPST